MPNIKDNQPTNFHYGESTSFIFLEAEYLPSDYIIIKPRGLTERQKAVVATMRMRLTRTQALAYLQGEGHAMSNATLAGLRKNKLNRLHYIAAVGFEDQHLDTIDNCEHIEQLMWKDYFLEHSAYKRVMILKEIKELQLYIS